MKKALACLMIILVGVLNFEYAHAAVLPDVLLHVDASAQDGAALEVGQKLTFTLSVTNNSADTVDAALTNNYDNWTQILRIPAGAVRTAVMEYSVTTATTAANMQFDFYGKVGEDDVSFANGTVGYNFNYKLTEKKSLKFDVQSRNADDLAVGDTLTYIVVVTNDGNVEARNVRVEQSLDPSGYETLTVVLPGEQKVLNMTYKIPNDTKLGRSITNTFSLTADGFASKHADMEFEIEDPGNGVDVSVVADPAAYYGGDYIDLVVTLRNTSESPMDDLEIRSTSGGKSIASVDDLESGSSTTVRIPYQVPYTNDQQYFYVYNDDVYQGEAVLHIRPAIAPTPSPRPSATPTPAPTAAAEAPSDVVLLVPGQEVDPGVDMESEWTEEWDETAEYSEWDTPDDWQSDVPTDEPLESATAEPYESAPAESETVSPDEWGDDWSGDNLAESEADDGSVTVVLPKTGDEMRGLDRVLAGVGVLAASAGLCVGLAAKRRKQK